MIEPSGDRTIADRVIDPSGDRGADNLPNRPFLRQIARLPDPIADGSIARSPDVGARFVIAVLAHLLYHFENGAQKLAQMPNMAIMLHNQLRNMEITVTLRLLHITRSRGCSQPAAVVTEDSCD